MNIKTIIEKYTDRAKEYIREHNINVNEEVRKEYHLNTISFTTIVKYVGEITDGRENQMALEDGVIFSEKHCAIIQRDPDLTPNEIHIQDNNITQLSFRLRGFTVNQSPNSSTVIW